MEAIKNPRESSVLLSNLSPLTYYSIAYAIYAPEDVADVCDIIHDPSEYVDTLINMVRHCAELRAKSFFDALEAYATEDDYRAIYDELLAIHEWEEGKRKEAVLSEAEVSEEELRPYRQGESLPCR